MAAFLTAFDIPNPANSVHSDQAASLVDPNSGLPNSRSCVTCRRRRVRCDRHQPCSNCDRAQIQCVFPPPQRASRRTRQVNHDTPVLNPRASEIELMKRRLQKLENIVTQLSGHVEVNRETCDPRPSSGYVSSKVTDPDATNSTGVASRQESNIIEGEAACDEDVAPELGRTDPGLIEIQNAALPADLADQFGRLVVHDNGSTGQYISSAFWSKLNDEVNRKEPILANIAMCLTNIFQLKHLHTDMYFLNSVPDNCRDNTSSSESPRQASCVVSDRHSIPFAFGSMDVDLQALRPREAEISILWKTYRENIDPILKILHIPSMEKVVRRARRSPSSLEPGSEALLFAIYHAAIASLEDEEVQSNFKSSKPHLLGKYRFALEQALVRADFLNILDITLVQAFTIFLTLVRRQDNTRFCWTAVSLVIRMAQGLGIHRDGTKFALAPFEVEMRRRLWWAICTLDLRSAEEAGTALIIGNSSFDTMLPLNIDDTDISPEKKESPTPRDGRSDCSICLVRYEVCAVSRRLYFASTEPRPADADTVGLKLEEREKMLIEVKNRVEQKFLRYQAFTEDSLGWMVAIIARLIMAKVCLAIYHPALFPGISPEQSKDMRDRLYISAIQIMEYYHILSTDGRCRQWRWIIQTYRQSHAVAYVLMETSQRPWTAMSERAWEAVNLLRRDGEAVNSTAEPDPTIAGDTAGIRMPLDRLFTRMASHRQAEILRIRSNPVSAHESDVQERMSAFSKWLDSAPGLESRLQQIDNRWRRLVQQEGSEPCYPSSTTPTPWTELPAMATWQPEAAVSSGLWGDQLQFQDATHSLSLNPPEQWLYDFGTTNNTSLDTNSHMAPCASTASHVPLEPLAGIASIPDTRVVSNPLISLYAKQTSLAYGGNMPPDEFRHDTQPWLWPSFPPIPTEETATGVINRDVGTSFNESNLDGWQRNL
ncbi:fungal specific transcription factor domain-containing protein [Metarhizium robertsii ARSEF 23]|uniref:Fungal specific transcription factor domain-containing protein n=1 Tax=Metarhizium robertsii (strain ARSEF 23 / ATCC MYA-3075) TaxID=655844 RepID=E9F3K8_METRA|nr:fungal specific transcription factor domain-containing protein [Metarhizium robertsii ARSEF 23]EFY97745.1 fungal specific transcription factor domain-containing protein [Metarhizium robertsii ARSEF 23]